MFFQTFQAAQEITSSMFWYSKTNLKESSYFFVELAAIGHVSQHGTYANITNWTLFLSLFWKVCKKHLWDLTQELTPLAIFSVQINYSDYPATISRGRWNRKQAQGRIWKNLYFQRFLRKLLMFYLSFWALIG